MSLSSTGDYGGDGDGGDDGDGDEHGHGEDDQQLLKGTNCRELVVAPSLQPKEPFRLSNP